MCFLLHVCGGFGDGEERLFTKEVAWRSEKFMLVLLRPELPTCTGIRIGTRDLLSVPSWLGQGGVIFFFLTLVWKKNSKVFLLCLKLGSPAEQPPYYLKICFV